jgi:ketosteroid isomerase-like protein
MSAEDAVRNASEQFYTAVNRMLNGNAGAMTDIWSHGAEVTIMHPIGGRQVGWDNVRGSFEQVARMASAGQAILGDQMIQVAGDVAYEIGVERGKVTFAGAQFPLDHRVTNIYRRESGQWRIVHHHTDASPALAGVLNRS